MTYEERTTQIKAWVMRFLARKATPKRLETEQAMSDESRAMASAINRHTPSDATRDQVAAWLERLEGNLDEADIPSWPSIGEVVKSWKRALPEPERAAIKTANDGDDEAGHRMAAAWLRSAAARDHFLDGSHLGMAQWIRREGRMPAAREVAEIRHRAAGFFDFIASAHDIEVSRPVRVTILTSANTMLSRRIAAYDAGRKIHDLPETPEWMAKAITAMEAARDAISSALAMASAQRGTVVLEHGDVKPPQGDVWRRCAGVGA